MYTEVLDSVFPPVPCSAVPELSFSVPRGVIRYLCSVTKASSIPPVPALTSTAWQCNSSATAPTASQARKAMTYPRPRLTYWYFFADLGTQLLSEAERKRFPEHWILWRHRYILTIIKKFQHLGVFLSLGSLSGTQLEEARDAFQPLLQEHSDIGHKIVKSLGWGTYHGPVIGILWLSGFRNTTSLTERSDSWILP